MKNKVVLFLSLLLCTSCLNTPDPAYVDQIMKWRADRVNFLKSEAGFVNLAGLYWFTEGPNLLGSEEAADVVLSADFPARLATIDWAGDYAIISDIRDDHLLVNNERVVLDTVYRGGKPKEISWGTYRLYVIKRADQLGLRVKNYAHPRLAEVLDIPYYPIKEEWVIQGRFEPYQPPKTLMIQNIVGLTYPVESPGRLV